MIERVSKNECSGCAACAAVCPKACIKMTPDGMGFLHPEVAADACVKCGLCLDRCPVYKKSERTDAQAPRAYAVMANDATLREQSSSGGVFSLIARHILSQGGVVLGAAFEDGYHAVRHDAAESQEQLGALRGAKYLQSEIGDAYTCAKAYLEEGRAVLFTGTPCQVSGLKAFLNKEYDNLYLQDIVCHGVPSAAVWGDYLSHLEKKYGAHAVRVCFRDKTNGREGDTLRIEFDNGKVYARGRTEDPYMRGFLHNVFLRPSCYACAHKGLSRASDVTLADFWGIESVCPTLSDGKGTSLVLVSTPKGEQLLERISTDVRMQEVGLDDALAQNPSATACARESSSRAAFEREFGERPLWPLLKKYCALSPIKRLKKAVKALLHK